MTATEPRADNDTPSIRVAAVADAAALTAFARQAYAHHYGDLWTPAGLAGWMQSNYGAAAIAAELGEPARVRYLLCERAGRLLGYAKVAPDRPVPTQPGAIGLELEKFYVSGDATGSGVGSALLRHVLAFAHAAGHATIWLDVLRTNQRAIRLYRRWGFKVVGEIPFATDRLDIGMFVMRRDTAV